MRLQLAAADRITGSVREARGDFGRSRELAHVLKGAAAMMGADRLRQCAGRLEALSGSDLTDTGAHVVMDVKATLQDLKATLHATSDELVRPT